MTDLFWFTILSLMCVGFTAWAAEDETVREKAERLSNSRKIGKMCKRVKRTGTNRAARWLKYAR